MYSGFFDGGATPNPGAIGIGFCIFKDQQEVVCGAGPGGHGTNNEAEYKALIWLLEECVNQGIRDITCYGDSQLIIKQVNKEWRVGKEELKQLSNKARSLLGKLDNVKLVWIPREKNGRADALSKRGAQLHEKKLKVASTTNKKVSSVVSLTERRGVKSLVMPMMKNELVILEGNVPVYLNVFEKSCSCASFVKNHTCRHLAALKSVTSKYVV